MHPVASSCLTASVPGSEGISRGSREEAGKPSGVPGLVRVPFPGQEGGQEVGQDCDGFFAT